jgi:shikimate kinase
LVATDGVDGSGKTALGRYLSWQIGSSLIETDLFLTGHEPSYRMEEDRPVLCKGEGIDAHDSTHRPIA